MNRENYLYIKDIQSRISGYYKLNDEISLYIACQFALESQYGKSTLVIAYNNHCGMRVPFVRISTAINQGNAKESFAHYICLKACISDYILCLQYHRPLRKDLEDLDLFKAFIRKFYCPERDYIDKVNKIYQQFKSYKNE